MSDANRCGSFGVIHCEKRQSLVCWSKIDSLREEMHFLMVLVQVDKNSLAKEVEPTGWPRRRKPVVSLTGINCDCPDGVDIVVIE